MDPAVDPVTEFLTALRDADSALASARAGWPAPGYDAAFGRLFEAHDVLAGVAGFKGLDQMRARFEIETVEGIGRSIDSLA